MEYIKENEKIWDERSENNDTWSIPVTSEMVKLAKEGVWSIDKKREVAQDLVDSNYISYLTLEEDRIVGFMSLVKNLVAERMILDLIQVDKDFRGQGIGRMLWKKAMGADVTDNPIMTIADDEPNDLQMVYPIM